MSTEQAKAAIHKVKTDSEFRKQVMDIPDTGKRVQYINKAGFECSADELGEIAKLERSIVLDNPMKSMVINWAPKT